MKLLRPIPMVTLLPTLGLTEQQMIDLAVPWVARVQHMMKNNFSPEWLKTNLLKGLRKGALTLTIKAVEAAEKHEDEIADAALRQVGAEMMGGRIVEGEGGVQIWAYYQRSGLRPPLTRPRGHRWYDDWIRNLGICFLVGVACREFNLLPTRNRESRRANSTPSGISIIVEAMNRNGMKNDRGKSYEESSVQENIWLGLPGELARRAMAERPLQSWLVVP